MGESVKDFFQDKCRDEILKKKQEVLIKNFSNFSSNFPGNFAQVFQEVLFKLFKKF
jgi:hypothetical protein